LAVNGGVDVVTHAPLDRVLDATTVQKMAERSIVSLPTLTMMQGTNMAAKCGCFRIKDMVTDYANSRESVTMLHQAGVTILAGTDANTTPRTPAQIAHGKAMHEELALLVEAGLSPIEALRAATSVAAHYFGLTDRGVIEVGRRADLLLVEGDPTIDIKATRNIRRVWCAGIAYTPVAAR
jgi:imidazolonepropionase-like amidohydrolase